jgi:hypothetical protein
MKKMPSFKKFIASVILASSFAVSFTGCKGAAGDPGAPGINTNSTTTVNSYITTTVNIATIPTTTTPGPLSRPSTSAWSFGVMSDTQWTGVPDDGSNPYSVPVDIIKQINQEMINKNVKFVIQVGDLTNDGTSASKVVTAPSGTYLTTYKTDIDTRAAFAQSLYSAGVGFFPFRGNHEDYAPSATEFVRVFPQTQNGTMNATPSDVFTFGTNSNPDSTLQPFPVQGGATFTIGTAFSSPTSTYAGLTYSFDYQNARFVLLDQFHPSDSMNADGTPWSLTTSIAAQQPWITARLSGRAANTHAFVFSHKGLITENHVDTLFGTNPADNKTGQDNFINSLANNGVRYLQLGHDHMHDRSLVYTTDGYSNHIQQIVGASDSSKFYIPSLPSNDDLYDRPTGSNPLNSLGFGHDRQVPIAQELNTVGYYIYTVDGPRVTVDYYSAVVYPFLQAGEYNISTTPLMHFVKRESFGYSLNGKEFIVREGALYNDLVMDVYSNGTTTTTMQILDGYNDSHAMDGSGRALVKAVNTGWTARTTGIASNILTLWGMSDLGSNETDEYVLSMSFDPTGVSSATLSSGTFGLATRDANGNWINAVNQNYGYGAQQFVYGPYVPGYAVGTYGVDPSTNTAWAVINYNSDFAVVSGI